MLFNLSNLLYLLFLFSCLFYYSSAKLPIGKYPLIKRLNNGNYIILSEVNIVFLDADLTTIINTIDFESYNFNSVHDIFSTTIDQFLKEDGDYIIAIIKSDLYILSQNGSLLNKTENINLINPHSIYSIIPYGHSSNEFYFSIITMNPSKTGFNQTHNIIFRSNIYDSSANIINFNDSKIISFDNIDDLISCGLMKYSKKNVIACITGNYDNLFINIFDPYNNFNHLVDFRSQKYEFAGGHYFKLVVIQDERQKAIVCSFTGEYLYCLKYDISINSFQNFKAVIGNNCLDYKISLIIEYFYETNEFLVGCLGNEKNLYIAQFSNDFTPLEVINEIINSTNGEIGRGNFFFSFCQKKYGIFINPNNNNQNFEQKKLIDNLLVTKTFHYYPKEENCLIELNCSNKFYNYNRTECIDEIPEGYYCNDSDHKTIDKCHENCKNCSEGPTDNNNNCLTCPETDTIYFNLGNCVSNCTNGFFIEDSIKKCKCETNKVCKYCSYESQKYNLCDSCNNDLGYFSKLNDSNNKESYFNCYNESTISDGYFLNNDTKQYEPCFSSCKKCYGKGDEDNNKCLICKDLYFNFVFDDNCYFLCIKKYYFDSYLKFHCENNCPDGYKLLHSQNMCVNDCSSFLSNYKYEYNGVCYPECPNGTVSIYNQCILKNEESNSDLFSDLSSSLIKTEICPYLIKETGECTNECEIINYLKNKCITINSNETIKEKNILNIQNSITSHAIEPLLDNITKGNSEDIIIDEKDIKYQLTSSSNQNNKEYKNISSIQLGECENKLKNYYNISESETLLIFKVDIYFEGYSSPIVIYEIYHPTKKERLDLIHCKGVNIKLSLPANINESQLFKHDPTNEFYKDICTTYTTENGTDITLNDRQNEFIENNLSLCQNECKFSYYDQRTKKVNCECITKIKFPLISEIKIDKEKLKNNFINIKSITNIIVMKCYQKLLTKEGLNRNLGSYLLLSIIFFFIVSSNLFLLIEYDIIFNKIEEIFKYRNHQKSDNIENFENNTIKKEICIYEKQEKYIKNDNNNEKKFPTIKKKKKLKKSKTKNEKNFMHNSLNNKNLKIKDLLDNIKNYPPKKAIKSQKKSNILNKINNNIIFDLSQSKSKIEFKNSQEDLNNEKDINNLKELNIHNHNDIKKKKNNKKNIMEYNDYELNHLEYNEALKSDKRTYIQYYFSLLRTKHILLFAFIPSNDYNSTIIKICLFLFYFALYFTINALFFTDSTIHEIYKEKGEYNFIYQIPQIIYSTIISSIINIIIRFFSLSERDVLKIKREKINYNSFLLKKKFKYLRIKFSLFFRISIVFLILFWYYLACFCAIYRNTQIHLLKDTIISFALSLTYPLGLYLLPGIFRIYSLKKENKRNIYLFSKLLQFI